ncbi:hypothetical protein GYA44_00950 [Candidatus Microgenomates bacterium]|nr:hypothetical protein [Candidatus Microgenomates bacterium]
MPDPKDKKGKELNNFNEVHTEKKGGRIDIFRGSGGTDPSDSNDLKAHSHTVIIGKEVVYDRDENGTVFTDKK